MQTTGDALLQAILDEPDDDGLRLIYADWLQDHGEPDRAEFIRLEVAMFPRYLDATADDGPTEWEDPEFHQMGSRRDELLEQHGDVWFGAIARLVHSCTTVRGFVHYVDLDARVLATRAAELFAAAPLLQMVYLDKLGRNMPAIARRPELARLRHLHFSDSTLGSAGIRHLCASPYLGNLRTFYAARSGVGTEGARILAATAALANLERLEIEDSPIYNDGATALFTSPFLGRVRELLLENCGLTDSCLGPFLRGDVTMRPEALSLPSNHLTRLAPLADSAALAGVRQLILYNNPLRDAVATLARSRHLRSLEELHLGNVEATEDGLADLVQSPVLATVRELSLRNNPFGPLVAEAIGTSRTLRRLTTFRLDGCGLGPASIGHFIRADLPALRSLPFGGNPIGLDGLRSLVASALVGQLTELGLDNCDLGDDGAEVLSGAETLRGVRSLGLVENRIGNRGARALAASPHLDGLASLYLWRNPIGKRAQKVLRDRFGDRVHF